MVKPAWSVDIKKSEMSIPQNFRQNGLNEAKITKTLMDEGNGLAHNWKTIKNENKR